MVTWSMAIPWPPTELNERSHHVLGKRRMIAKDVICQVVGYPPWGCQKQGSNLKGRVYFILKGYDILNPSILKCKNKSFFSFENVIIYKNFSIFNINEFQK